MAEILQGKSKQIVLTTSLVVAALLGVVALFLFDPARGVIYPVCLFHKFTGLNCPGCGSLRALHHLTHGEFVAALHCNPLLIAALPVLVLTRILRQGGRQAAPAGISRFARPVTAGAICAIVIVFGVLRNLPGPAFAWMSP